MVAIPQLLRTVKQPMNERPIVARGSSSTAKNVIEPGLLAPSDPPSNFGGMTPEEIVETITDWFHHNFEDPVHHTPYDDGEYIYINGNYSARDVIYENFSDAIPESLIEEAVNTIEGDGFEWVPTQWRILPPEDEEPSPEQLHATVLERIARVEEALSALNDPAVGIGHNGPPSPIEVDPLSLDERRMIASSLQALKEQPPTPPETEKQKIESATAKLAILCKKIGSWLAKQGDNFVTEAVKAAGKEIGTWLGRVGVWTLLFDYLKSLIEAASDWITAAFALF